eukprot:COSAG05_NODE_6096_length_1022_cov_1.646804_1_plen_59_part_10
MSGSKVTSPLSTAHSCRYVRRVTSTFGGRVLFACQSGGVLFASSQSAYLEYYYSVENYY